MRKHKLACVECIGDKGDEPLIPSHGWPSALNFGPRAQGGTHL